LRQVRVAGVFEDPSTPRLRYEPGHPDADGQGYVAYPNVDPVTEMVNLLGAARAYEANVTVLEATKSLMLRALEI
jgi:flagellar basal-body rod protein FlgC